MIPIVVYGAGGHGKVVAEILVAGGYHLLAFIDDDPGRLGSALLGLSVLPASEWLRGHAPAHIALGVGANHDRERVACRIKESGSKVLTLVHPGAIIARSAKIGEGSVIMPAAVLNPDCRIEDGVIVNTGAIVEHDVEVGHYAHLSPSSTIGGGAAIGAYAHIGIGASVLPSKRIGTNCIIGAGAVVTEDISDGQTAYGVPARVRVRV